MKITFKGIRISLLVIVFASVLNYTYHEKITTTSWEEPLEMVIYPINSSGSADVAKYIKKININQFQQDIDAFYEHEGKRYGVKAEPPILTELGPEIHSLPPARPRSGNIISNMLWSLKLRLWAYRNTPQSDSIYSVIRMYVIYHPMAYDTPIPHSSGLQKGLLGVVHAFAGRQQNQQNNVVIAHELLHTVGATDKYDPQTNQPLVPDGMGNPNQTPLYPQERAELMAGRIALSRTKSEMPASLYSCIIGETTAKEIGWMRILPR